MWTAQTRTQVIIVGISIRVIVTNGTGVPFRERFDVGCCARRRGCGDVIARRAQPICICMVDHGTEPPYHRTTTTTPVRLGDAIHHDVIAALSSSAAVGLVGWLATLCAPPWARPTHSSSTSCCSPHPNSCVPRVLKLGGGGGEVWGEGDVCSCLRAMQKVNANRTCLTLLPSIKHTCICLRALCHSHSRPLCR